MRKTDKKIDNQLRAALTDVCDIAMQEFKGFQWLTHLVKYSSFPNSLKVVCVFDTNENLSDFMSNSNNERLNALINTKLVGAGIAIKNITSHVKYDTEENCQKDHNGKWADRLS